MIIKLKPETDDELQELGAISQRNKDRVYNHIPTDVLEYEIPFSSEEIEIAASIKDVLKNGGRVLLLTSDSDIPQEITFQQEV